MADRPLAVASRVRAVTRVAPLVELRAAVAFLTRIPVGAAPLPAEISGAAAFGLVGGVIGLVAAAPVLVAGSNHPALAACLAVAVLAVIGGALHLDGLADTADALVAPAGTAEQARTDPRTGPAGVVAIAVVVVVDVVAVADLAERTPATAAAVLVAAAVVSRAAAPIWAFAVGRRLAAAGLGSWFADRVGAGSAIAVLVTAVVAVAGVALVGGGRAVAGAFAGGVLGTLVAAGVIGRRRQLDGDGYGAIVELTFAAILTGAALSG